MQADNQNHNSGQFTTKEDQEQFNSWNKQQIYEAYLSEHSARLNLNKEVNRLHAKIADIRRAIGG